MGIRELPWRRILLAAAGIVAFVAVVPPLRNAAANVTARTIMVVASPFTPDIGGFEDLPQTTRVLAADGAQVLVEVVGERVVVVDEQEHRAELSTRPSAQAAR